MEAIPPHPAQNGAVKRDPIVVERFRGEEVTARYRFKQFIGRFADSVVATGGITLILVPFLIIATLTLDLPMTHFDGWATAEAMRPSQWMARGDLVMAICVLSMVLMTRRFGASFVSRAWGFSWLVLVLLSGLMLLYLSPQLTAGDMPRGLYAVGFVTGWYIGGEVMIRFYDALRGSRWWRAPLLAGLFGFTAQAILFFPLAYHGTTAPWGLWLVADIGVKVFLCVLFLGVYRMMRPKLIPRVGLGGR